MTEGEKMVKKEPAEETFESLMQKISSIVDDAMESVGSSWKSDNRAMVFNQSNDVIANCKKRLGELVTKVEGYSEYLAILEPHLEDPLPKPPAPPNLLDRLMKTTGITGEEDFFASLEASLEEEGEETEDPYLYRVKVKGKGGFLARLLGQ